ncbi:hypothetical protein ACFTXJ_26495 [Streptomyces zhihengii]|uniref:hypothetical protein n=1 Tax=Streptomyces zhihengii TaxID=1818004 RepID=UPI00362C3BD7
MRPSAAQANTCRTATSTAGRTPPRRPRATCRQRRCRADDRLLSSLAGGAPAVAVVAAVVDCLLINWWILTVVGALAALADGGLLYQGQ